MDDQMASMVCTTCGRIPEDESAARLTWALGVENGQQVWTCDLCSREFLRSIEGKLDSQWW
jgi:DNA-directed RNA polymerase subunit RPC12/RpoP